MKRIEEPEVNRITAAKMGLKYAMECLDCKDYDELRYMCSSLLDMINYVNKKNGNYELLA